MLKAPRIATTVNRWERSIVRQRRSVPLPRTCHLPECTRDTPCTFAGRILQEGVGIRMHVQSLGILGGSMLLRVGMRLGLVRPIELLGAPA